MAQLNRLINSYLENGGIGSGLTMGTVQELIYIKGALARRERPCILDREVNRILNQCGIPTIEYNQGWKVARA